MIDKSKFTNVAGMSYNELLIALQEEFGLSKRSARQIVEIVCAWLEDEQE